MNQEIDIATQLDLVNKKLDDLSKQILTRANEDRVTAKDIADFAKAEIEKIEEDYDEAVEAYDKAYTDAMSEPDKELRTAMFRALGRRPYKKSLVGFIEQLNRSLEMSIKSSDNVVNLLSTLVKANSIKHNIKEVNIDNRALILEEIIEEEKKKETK